MLCDRCGKLIRTDASPPTKTKGREMDDTIDPIEAASRIKAAVADRSDKAYAAVIAGDVRAVAGSIPAGKLTATCSALLRGVSDPGIKPETEVFQVAGQLRHLLTCAGA